MAVQQKNHKTNFIDGLSAQKIIGFCRYATLYIRTYDLKSPCFIHGDAAPGMGILSEVFNRSRMTSGFHAKFPIM